MPLSFSTIRQKRKYYFFLPLLYFFSFFSSTFTSFCIAQGIQSPIVVINSSIGQTTYIEPARVLLNAVAYDPDGTIIKVEFYLCGTKLAETTSEPYEIIINGLTAGQYCITAKATDNTDSTTESYPLKITINGLVDSCKTLDAYVENGGYSAGSRIQNGNKKYECKPWPYSGWCNGASWAYAPGTGTNWQDAWMVLGSCIPDSNPPCGTTSPYTENESYGPESQVINQGIKYECKPWPYSGWCSGASWAYAPGTGMYWQDAWLELGPCSSSDVLRTTTQTKIIASPHPFIESTTIRLENNEEILSLIVYNTNGAKVIEFMNLKKTEITLQNMLSPGYYILHVTSSTGSYTQTLVKW